MWTGFLIACLSACGVLIMITLKIIFGDDYPLGIPTITVLVLFIGGVQLAAVGVLGEYIGRIYDEVRRVTGTPEFGQSKTSAAANAGWLARAQS